MTGNRQIKQLFNTKTLFWLLIGAGCVTGYKSTELDYSLQDIQKVVSEAMPSELAVVSTNGREYYTKPYDLNIEGARATKAVMRTTILGDRRPYQLAIEIRVVGNKGDEPDQAFQTGSPYFGEASLSKRIVKKVESELAKRRKNKNLFDDFKAF